MWALAHEYLPWFASEWHWTPQTVLGLGWVQLVRLTLMADSVEDARWAAKHKG